ncbi:heterokaryon incompatibility protein-domain-containing protein [Echria macrotheca]|uniref:Heterokaryon incompatibility protein-domain-containing protein n=1 Tax=Echria macrotheca TaxID=438768 RepID=A0AAJ0F5I9_9PEZI|nr:heterokaryon incompatibility protein-domain-containing protein [Echria macrotheca]
MREKEGAMRLINTETLELVDFVADVPPYAILSHTWDEGEVTCHDMTARSGPPDKQGWSKIVRTCGLARDMGLSYAWADTCCIDKTSSAELTESINSMFEWYRKATICIVYLSDLAACPASHSDLEKCRWFGRGWTLQELIAPETIHLYNKDWAMIGNKDNMSDIIAKITRIPESVIRGKTSFHGYSVAQRMSWAATRKTTRIEDRAYSLLGIFGIHMPMIYGEGVQAFRRLQEEIIKRFPDRTILAWQPEHHYSEVCSPLATSPDEFRMSHDIQRADSLEQPRLVLHPREDQDGNKHPRYMLEVGWLDVEGAVICIPLRKVGYATYFRETFPTLLKLQEAEWLKIESTIESTTRLHRFLLSDVRLGVPTSVPALLRSSNISHGAIYIDKHRDITINSWTAVPTAAYDDVTGLCFCPGGARIDFFACMFTATFGAEHVEFGVLLPSTFSSRRKQVALVDMRSPGVKQLFILLRRNPEEPMPWYDAEGFVGAMWNSVRVKIRDGAEMVRIRGKLGFGHVLVESQPFQLPCLYLDIDRQILEGPQRMEMNEDPE